MKLLGSSRVDDFYKVVLGKDVAKSLNVKPEDSVLFYYSDGEVMLCKTEGAQLNEYSNTIHSFNKTERSRNTILVLGTLLIVFLALIISMIVLVELFDYKLQKTSLEIILYVGFGSIFVVTVLLLQACLTGLSVTNESSGRLKLWKRGPYDNNRVFGLSKLTTNGEIISGTLYVNSLFGRVPETITAKIISVDDTDIEVLNKRIKTNGNRSSYKLRAPVSDEIASGKLSITATYEYGDKSIEARITYVISDDTSKGSVIKVKESDLETKLSFGDDFQKTVFDESLFDPDDEEE
ncbi:MAG: hypothetical protein WC067_03140 [Candidatus Methanomethylophilaceae archaeon]